MLKLVLTLLWSSSLFAQSFTNGNEFTSVDLEGELYLTCHGQNQTVRVKKYCEKSTLLPTALDYFETQTKIDGDRVRIKNITNDETTYDRTVYYNKDRQRTQRKIKLWSEYWGERGLLVEGDNRVAYEFLNKNKDTLAAGIVDIRVNRGEYRRCRPDSDVSYNLNDCYYGDARIFCDRYFERQFYCD